MENNEGAGKPGKVLLHAKTAVEVYVAPHPPSTMTLRWLAGQVRSGYVPPSAGVRLPGSQDWMSAEQVIAMCPAVQPIQASLFMIVLVAVPLVLVLLQGVLFGAAGIAWLLPLLGVGAVVAAAIALTPTWRTRKSSTLFRGLVTRRAFAIPGALLLFGTELPAVFVGVHSRKTEKRIDALLNGSQPCAVAALSSADVAWIKQHPGNSQGDDGSFNPALPRIDTYRSQVDACNAQRKHEAMEKDCAKIAKALAARKTPPDVRTLDKVVGLPRRIAQRKLKASDLALQRSELFCSKSSHATDIWNDLIDAARQSDSAWASVQKVSSDLAAGLEAKGLTDASRKALEANAKATAIRALDAATMSQQLMSASEFCALTKRLNAEPDECQKVEPRRLELSIKEKAEAERKQKVQDAKEKREEARCAAIKKALASCEDRCDARLPKDGLGFPKDFDKAIGSSCYDNCDRHYEVRDDCE